LIDPLPVIDLAEFEGQPLPERKWLVRDRIPARNVTLLSGEGAVGKSLVALQLAVATVLGREWLGIELERGNALVVCCEDDATEMHIRLASIIAFYGASFPELMNRLFPISLVGRETALAVPDRGGQLQPTALYWRLLAIAKKIRPVLIVLDNSADLFAGNENDRAQVRRFITLLRRLADETGAAVLLTSHPSVRGVDTGTGLSGSTAWHASVRSRLYMRRPKSEGERAADPDERVLEVLKNNYGPPGETISLRWQNGLFISETALTHFDKVAATREAEALFLHLLASFEQQGRNVGHKPTSPTYAPTAFATTDEAQKARVKKATFAAMMEPLFRSGQIHVQNYGRPSRPYQKIAIGPPK
jgi:RecA-family ATPase